MILAALIWIATLFTAQACWLVIFHSPLIPGLIDRGRGELFTRADVERWLLTRGDYKLHTLWTCQTCQAVWTGVGGVLLFAAAYRLLGCPPVASLLTGILVIILLLGSNIILSKWLQKTLL